MFTGEANWVPLVENTEYNASGNHEVEDKLCLCQCYHLKEETEFKHINTNIGENLGDCKEQYSSIKGKESKS